MFKYSKSKDCSNSVKFGISVRIWTEFPSIWKQTLPVRNFQYKSTFMFKWGFSLNIGISIIIPISGSILEYPFRKWLNPSKWWYSFLRTILTSVVVLNNFWEDILAHSNRINLKLVNTVSIRALESVLSGVSKTALQRHGNVYIVWYIETLIL